MKGPLNHASGLITMAEQDILVLDRFVVDHEILDAIWGLHAQQAVEKLLKSILAARAVNFPYTHQLYHLNDALLENGVRLPERFELLLQFTPYAGELRYSPVVVATDRRIDRPGSLTLIRELRHFVREQIGL